MALICISVLLFITDNRDGLVELLQMFSQKSQKWVGWCGTKDPLHCKTSIMLPRNSQNRVAANEAKINVDWTFDI